MKSKVAWVLFVALVAVGQVQAITPALIQSNNLDSDYDVVVVGAGTSGVAAAAQAASMGARVALIEETDWIGGQLTAAGVSTSDDYMPSLRSSGIFSEYRRNLVSLYGDRPIGTMEWHNFEVAAEPDHAQMALKQVLDDARSVGGTLDISLYTQVLEVRKTGNTVNQVLVRVARPNSDVVTRAITLRVLIDATEYGYLLPMAGVRYRVGNATSDSPITAQHAAAIQNITYTAVVRKYGKSSQDIPSVLRPGVSPPGEATYFGDDGDRAEFERLIDVNGHDGRTEFNPDGTVKQHHNPGDPVLGDYEKAWTPTYHNGYRGMPDEKGKLAYAPGDTCFGHTKYTGLWFECISRTGLNRANDYPNSLYYTQSPDAQDSVYLTGKYLLDPVYRKEINCKARLKTLNYLYFLQGLRETNGSDAWPGWSVANDEGYDSPYHLADLCDDVPLAYKPIESFMPVVPYVRESLRMIGLYTVSAKDVQRCSWPLQSAKDPHCITAAALDANFAYAPDLGKSQLEYPPSKLFQTSVVLGDYGLDLHDTEEDSLLESDLETTSDNWSGMGGQGRFEIPFKAFIPEVVDGFVPAEKNISQSRLVSGGTRLHPSTMRIGHAAGAIAALAALNHKAPRDVAPVDVQLAVASYCGQPDALGACNGVEITHRYFDDINRSQEYWADVQVLSARGVFRGNSLPTWQRHFYPQNSLTRAETAVVLTRLLLQSSRLMNAPQAPQQICFGDVPLNHWAASEICYIAKEGITTGTNGIVGPQGVFDPNGIVTNAQMAVFLARALALDVAHAPVTPIYYSDVPASHWAFPYVQALASAGVALGCGSAQLCPNAQLNRAGAARRIVKALRYIEATPRLKKDLL